MTYVIINADVEINLRDIDLCDIEKELESRKIKYLKPSAINEYVNNVKFKANAKDEAGFLLAAKTYFYECYGIIY